MDNLFSAPCGKMELQPLEDEDSFLPRIRGLLAKRNPAQIELVIRMIDRRMEKKRHNLKVKNP